MLKVGRSQVRFLKRRLDFLNLPNPSRRTVALELAQPLEEMSNRNFPGE
jgi:hypothetical protein